MKKLIWLLVAFMLAVPAVTAQGFFGGGGKGGSSPSTPSPFVPAGFANVTSFIAWGSLSVSPDGKYVYVAGNLGSGANDAAIAQVQISDGSVKAICDLGAGTAGQATFGTAVSPDSNHLYTWVGGTSHTWFDVATSGMTVAHQSSLTDLPTTQSQNFDLSPDGSTFAYIEGGAGSTSLHMLNTSTYVETSVAMNHTAGNLTAVCFYNGSSSNVYVAHAGSGAVDLYTTAGSYTSTVSTGAGGTPSFTAMRSGINNSFYIADSGTNKALIQVISGTPTINLTTQTVNALAISTAASGDDVCVANSATAASDFLVIDSFQFYSPPYVVPMGGQILYNGASGVALSPDPSMRIFSLGGFNYPEVWCINNTPIKP